MKRFALVVATLLLVSCASAPPPRMHALRMRPGSDLRLALEEWSRAHGIRAGAVVTCAGSVRRSSLRFADRKEPTLLEGPFEIVSLTGTLSPDGVHLHMSASDGDGHTVGGHLGEGTIVYTTAEIVLVELREVEFSRAISGDDIPRADHQGSSVMAINLPSSMRLPRNEHRERGIHQLG
jgi:predicted DNA-binding protein with PD1-like motif